jgi:hypothetical protein
MAYGVDWYVVLFSIAHDPISSFLEFLDCRVTFRLTLLRMQFLRGFHLPSALRISRIAVLDTTPMATAVMPVQRAPMALPVDIRRRFALVTAVPATGATVARPRSLSALCRDIVSMVGSMLALRVRFATRLDSVHHRACAWPATIALRIRYKPIKL